MGTVTVKYPPHLFKPESTVLMVDHYGQQLDGRWSAIATVSGVLLTVAVIGVVVRKFGAIVKMERFMYGPQKDD